jgi:hypothetical protein
MNIRLLKKYFKSATGFFSSSEEARANDYDAFDYVNGDFDRVIAGSTKAPVATTTAPSFATTPSASPGTGSTVQLPAASRGNPVTPVGISPASSPFSPTGDQSKPDSSLHIERKRWKSQLPFFNSARKM